MVSVQPLVCFRPKQSIGLLSQFDLIESIFQIIGDFNQAMTHIISSVLTTYSKGKV